MDYSDPSTWRWIWLAAMVVFGVGEMATAGSFFLAPFALGAGIAALLAFAGVSLGIEWVVFLAVSGAAFLAMRPIAKRLDRDGPGTGVGSKRHEGQVARVVEAIGGPHDPGMVLLGAEQWRADSADGSPVPVDTQVIVTEVRGTRVLVTPTKPD